MTATVDRRSLSEQIKDALIAQITEGELGPGDRLVELKIAEKMQTSQAPVREALRELDALGLIEMRRNRGAVVREIDLDELRDIYAVRAELEGLAAQEAAKQAPEIGAELLVLCKSMSKAVREGDQAAFVAINDAFHRSIIEASSNAVLLEVWHKLDIRARTAINIARRDRPLDQAVEDHVAIAKAIQSGNAQEARAASGAHVLAVLPERSETTT